MPFMFWCPSEGPVKNSPKLNLSSNLKRDPLKKYLCTKEKILLFAKYPNDHNKAYLPATVFNGLKCPAPPGCCNASSEASHQEFDL